MKRVMVKVKVKSQVITDRATVLGQAQDFTLGIMVNKRRRPCFCLITFPECMLHAGHSSKYITQQLISSLQQHCYHYQFTGEATEAKRGLSTLTKTGGGTQSYTALHLVSITLTNN